jgi:hypothetical protein
MRGDFPEEAFAKEEAYFKEETSNSPQIAPLKAFLLLS